MLDWFSSIHCHYAWVKGILQAACHLQLDDRGTATQGLQACLLIKVRIYGLWLPVVVQLDSIPLFVDLPLQGSQAQRISTGLRSVLTLPELLSNAYGKVMRIPAMKRRRC